MDHNIICFGELLLRLSAPGPERLLQSPTFNVAVGGAEANVAVCLARFGHSVGFASVVSDNELGEAALQNLRQHGVDVAKVARSSSRMGLYFLSQGAVTRPSQVLYDRADTAFSCDVHTRLDPEAVLADAQWLHLSGVSPATGPNGAQASLDFVTAAKAHGLTVSFDGNYRAHLWAAWGQDGRSILKEILAKTTIAFINEKDIELILGEAFNTREEAFAAAFAHFPNLTTLAATSRDMRGVNDLDYAGELVTRDARYVSRRHQLTGIVDRIGTGDAFAAGLIHALIAKKDGQRAVEFAVACAVIKHSIPGDFNLTSLKEVSALVDESRLDVQR